MPSANEQSDCAPPETTNQARLVQGPVGKTLYRMALPMLAGTFAMNAFNLTDTWFVAQLGNQSHSVLPLAAMGFTLPVVMFFFCIIFGVGMGATAVISSALGQGDHDSAKQLTTHALILAAVLAAVFSIVGLLTIEPLFRLLGADEVVLPLIKKYITIWYLGIIFIVMPMTAGSIMRATGDTVRPSLLMCAGSVVNMILDPLLIFGLAGFPRMGIAGAALATVISRGIACVGVFWILSKHHKLLDLHSLSWMRLTQSWRKIMHIGLPASLSNLLVPIAGGVITRVVTHYGDKAAVAACAAGGRLEMFAFMIPMCLGMSLLPFVGQNYGAGRLDRIKQGARVSIVFALLFGLVIFVCFFTFAPQMASLFVKEAEGRRYLILYLRIISFGYGLMEVHRYSGFLLNGIHKPLHATGLNILRVGVLLVPLSLLGGRFLGGVIGIFWGRLAADVLSGVLGIAWYKYVMRRHELNSLF